jgi:hypothetical protein
VAEGLEGAHLQFAAEAGLNVGVSHCLQAWKCILCSEEVRASKASDAHDCQPTGVLPKKEGRYCR